MSVFVDPTPTVKQIAYMLTITSAAELKKAAAKRKPKTQNLHLDSDEPWDTFKAQILVKISTAIKPTNINFNNYTLQFSVTHLVPKPGMPIDSEGDYLFMIEQAVKTKTLMVSITINEDVKEDGSDKENNEGSDKEEENKKQRKKVSIQPVLNYGSFCSCIMTIEWQATTSICGKYQEDQQYPVAARRVDMQVI